MNIIEVKTPEDFEKYYELRWRILRAPWGKPRGEEVDETDPQSVNIMLTDDSGKAIAVGRLHMNNKYEAQVRYVAVDDAQQGKGVGRILMEELERRALEDFNAEYVMLHAREKAVPFYEALNYQMIGPSYLLFGEIQHFEMVKQL
jgi:predicted GNAT family N-acyltransferase